MPKIPAFVDDYGRSSRYEIEKELAMASETSEHVSETSNNFENCEDEFNIGGNARDVISKVSSIPL